jgi:hypothetical protein
MSSLSFSAVPVVALVRRFFNVFAFAAASGQSIPREPTARSITPWSLSLWSKRQISNSPSEARAVEMPQTLPPPGPEEPKPPQREPPKRRALKDLYAHKDDVIHQLLLNPALYNPLHPPRFPIVLCHGACTFHIISERVKLSVQVRSLRLRCARADCVPEAADALLVQRAPNSSQDRWRRGHRHICPWVSLLIPYTYRTSLTPELVLALSRPARRTLTVG